MSPCVARRGKGWLWGCSAQVSSGPLGPLAMSVRVQVRPGAGQAGCWSGPVQVRPGCWSGRVLVRPGCWSGLGAGQTLVKVRPGCCSGLGEGQA